MRAFVGRERELGSLRSLLRRVEQGAGGAKPGRLVLVRGRRRVGKSTLVEELIGQTGCPSLFFTASRQGDLEPGYFVDELARSTIPDADAALEQRPGSWSAALALLAAVLPDDQPSIVVVDEFPYLLEGDPTIDAVFQKAWDRQLARKPVLLALVGSDLAMMERLDDADRALHQRGTELVVDALDPREVATIVRAGDAAAALDAYLITGGLPLICNDWPAGADVWTFLETVLSDPTSPMIVSAERSLRAEFPAAAQAQAVLGQVGSGSVTFTHVARAGGGLTAAAVSRSLSVLQAKRLVAREVPLSTKRSKEARYRITDPYVQFWLRFVGPNLPEIERGRGDRVLERVRRDWSAWRGRAIEPVVREALVRLLPIDGLPDVAAVGGYWTRTNDPEVDFVGADRAPVATRIGFAGTIKWHDQAPLDQADLARLAADAQRIPGADAATPLVAVSRTPVTAKGAAATLGPEDLLQAWAAPPRPTEG